MTHHKSASTTRPGAVVDTPLLKKVSVKAARRRDAANWLNFARGLTITYLIVGIFGGILTALIDTNDPSVLGDGRYPYAGVGIAAVIFTIFSGTAVGAVLAYLQWRMAEGAEVAS